VHPVLAFLLRRLKTTMVLRRVDHPIACSPGVRTSFAKGRVVFGTGTSFAAPVEPRAC